MPGMMRNRAPGTAATSLVHGLAHLIIDGATPVKPGDVEHAARIARELTAVLGVGVLPKSGA